jgi:catechol 2,3-dioxygenase
MSSDFGIAPPAYRLPSATHVGAVTLAVADLDRSIDYYREVIGLHLLTREGNRATLGAPDERPLVILEAHAGLRPAPRRGAFGLYHFALLLPDRAALGRFVGHLGRFGVQVGMADHLVSEALYLTDPDGLGIEVYADRPRTTWRTRGQELAMTSDPLDVRSLLMAGGQVPWDGVPSGTVMGHMHLHVGDLTQAEAFYHRALGMDKIVWSYPGALFLSAGGYHHHLGTNTWSPGPSARPDEARLLEWTLQVPSSADVDAVEASVAAAGHATTRDESGRVRVADPWGTVIRAKAHEA